jgi:hypothetical protein
MRRRSRPAANPQASTDAWAAGVFHRADVHEVDLGNGVGDPGAAAVCEGGGMSRRLRRMPSRSWCVRADRQSSTLSTGSFVAELGKERRAPFLEGGELGA